MEGWLSWLVGAVQVKSGEVSGDSEFSADFCLRLLSIVTSATKYLFPFPRSHQLLLLDPNLVISSLPLSLFLSDRPYRSTRIFFTVSTQPSTVMTTPSAEDNMTAAPARISALIANLSAVTARASAAAAHSPIPNKPVRLVAVSKLKPASDILALHQPPASQLHFGENYLQELLEKSRFLPPSIKWHFIGGLQSNKCVTLARDVRGLWAVESVDTEKKANLLNKGWGERKSDTDDQGSSQSRAQSGAESDTETRLRIYIQVNTSGEENKAGIEPAAASGLARFIREKCPRLKLQGVMTIGAIARSRATTPEDENEDFVCLRETRDRIVSELGLSGAEAELELSMGMSSDFEGAIALGSDQIRVGTTIFGERPPKAQAKVV